MILVLLGTQDKPFTRLLQMVDEAVDKGVIKEEVIAQVGFTKYKSKNIKTFDLIPRDEMDKLIGKANLIITHGGVGFITDSIKHNKKIIAVPRLQKYGEHTNDHQIQIIGEFAKLGYLIPMNENDTISSVLERIKIFKPNKYKKNNKIMNIIEEYIENNSKEKHKNGKEK